MSYTVTGFPATDEQSAIIDMSKTGKSFLVDAFAGSAKSSTLTGVAANNPHLKFLYICYNKALQLEADELFKRWNIYNVECRTGHSLAYRSHGVRLAKQGRLKGRLKGSEVASALRLMDDNPNAPFGMTSTQKGYIILAWMQKHCNSANEIPSMASAPYGAIEIPATDHEEAFKIKQGILAPLEQKAIEFWGIWNNHPSMTATHDLYLKQWAMSNPNLAGYDCIMVDECQDCNPVFLQVLNANSDKQIIGVGDPRQQIYSWRGSINAMKSFPADGYLKITQSFRYGQSIADGAGKIIKHHLDEDVSIKGFKEANTQVLGEEHEEDIGKQAYISRTNASLIRGVMDVIGQDKKPYIMKGAKDMANMVTSIIKLQEGGTPFHPEISMFRSFNELREYADSPIGGDIKVLVDMTEKMGSVLVATLLSAGENKPEDSDVFFSTAHSSKGLEFDSIRLADDFLDVGAKGWKEEDGNLLYVAFTRAKRGVADISGCGAAKAAIFGDKQETEK